MTLHGVSLAGTENGIDMAMPGAAGTKNGIGVTMLGTAWAKNGIGVTMPQDDAADVSRRGLRRRIDRSDATGSSVSVASIEPWYVTYSKKS